MFTRLALPFTSILGISISLLAGCGGGNSNSDSDSTNNSTLPDTTWQMGQFQPSETFANYCANPRTGTDPFEGLAYPDKAGSAEHEKMWLRSFTHETYLWYDEVEDTAPIAADSVLKYFESLKTFQTTPTGNQKDNFHFTRTYEDYKKESQSGVSSGFGVRWSAISTKPPRIYRVAYTQDNSPAEIAGFKRGDTITAINGVSINSNDTEALLKGLNPESGTTHTFTLTRKGQPEPVLATVTASDIKLTPVQNAQTFDVNGQTVGYVQFNQFISSGQSDLINAFKQFQNAGAEALVLDMRYNGGGLVNMAAQLGYMIAGPDNTNIGTSNPKVFSKTLYNDKLSANNRNVTFENKEINWNTLQYTDTILPSTRLNTVYILSTSNTCSASELVINGLRGIDLNVVLIGTTTCGKPYGFVPAPNCGQVYYTIQFTSANAKNFGAYSDGFTPVRAMENIGELGLTSNVSGCFVNDDFDHALGDPLEGQLKAALEHFETGNCPKVLQNRALNYEISDFISAGVALEIPNSLANQGTILTEIIESK
jgi:C-terminal processing protease CtpA/Prc